MKKPFLFRQGDVLGIPVRSIPADAKDVTPKKGRIVLMHGEVTGHAHAFYDDSQNVKLYTAHSGARYVHVTAPANLSHEEHTTARLPAGKYLLPTQMEYTAAEFVRVED